MKYNNDYLVADWPAPACVKTMVTLRSGGNMSLEDAPLWRQWGLPHMPKWLKQVHGVGVVDLKEAPAEAIADAVYTRTPGQVCAVLTADCLPVLLCSKDGSQVAAVHAGWRGLSSGIIDETLKHLQIPPHEVLAWMGPAHRDGSF
jgi:YfiH family protein